jgi:protein-tyrosine phosphatase
VPASGENVSDVVRCTVLCVCTGNICRSPAAELLLAARLDDGVRVESAGMRAQIGRPIARPMAERLRAAGVDPDGFAARQLLAATVRTADLVLTMTRSQRAAVERLAPSASDRTFTLLEFARLVAPFAVDDHAGSSSGERRATLVAHAASLRRMAIGRVDVVDPFGRSSRAYDRAFADIERATDVICGALGGAGVTQDWS